MYWTCVGCEDLFFHLWSTRLKLWAANCMHCFGFGFTLRHQEHSLWGQLFDETFDDFDSIVRHRHGQWLVVCACVWGDSCICKRNRTFSEWINVLVGGHEVDLARCSHFEFYIHFWRHRVSLYLLLIYYLSLVVGVRWDFCDFLQISFTPKAKNDRLWSVYSRWWQRRRQVQPVAVWRDHTSNVFHQFVGRLFGETVTDYYALCEIMAHGVCLWCKFEMSSRKNILSRTPRSKSVTIGPFDVTKIGFLSICFGVEFSLSHTKSKWISNTHTAHHTLLSFISYTAIVFKRTQYENAFIKAMEETQRRRWRRLRQKRHSFVARIP